MSASIHPLVVKAVEADLREIVDCFLKGWAFSLGEWEFTVRLDFDQGSVVIGDLYGPGDHKFIEPGYKVEFKKAGEVLFSCPAEKNCASFPLAEFIRYVVELEADAISFSKL